MSPPLFIYSDLDASLLRTGCNPSVSFSNERTPTSHLRAIYEPSGSLPYKITIFPCYPSAGFSGVPLVNQVHYNLHHYILFFCLALRNHQGQSNEGIVCQTF